MFLINSLAGGGAERVMSTLLDHSRPESREFDVSLALLDKETAAFEAPSWLTVHQLDCGASTIASVRGVGRLCRELRPDLVLSFLTRSNVANVLSRRGSGHAAVISERVNTTTHFGAGVRGLIGKLMVRASYPRASRVIAVSAGVAQDLRANFGVADARLTTIENPFDLDMIRAQGGEAPAVTMDEPYVAAVGRLVPNKNFRLLIEAFRCADLPGKLVILGDGPLRPDLLELIGRLGLTGRVLLPGFVANPFAVVKRASAFVLPSDAEGFPNSLVEAMALGVPVISTNCASGPSEILAERDRGSIRGLLEGRHGVLTPPGSVDALAQALRILQSPEARGRYGAAASLRAEAFSVEKAKSRYWDLIRGELSGVSRH